MPGRDIHGHRSPPLPKPPLFYFADKFPILLRPPPWLLSILKPALKPVRKELEIYRGEGIWNIVLANIESAKQTRIATRIVSHRFACTNASSLIFLFFFSSSLLWRKREKHDWSTRYVFLYGDRFSIRRGRRVPHYPWWRACGIILGKDFRRRLRLEVEDLHRNRIQRNPTFRNFVFLRRRESRALIPPSSLFFFFPIVSLESFG